MSDILARALASDALTQSKPVLAIKDVKYNYGASGSSENTTGSIVAGGNQLSLTSSIDFENGQGIAISNAGPLVSSFVPNPTIAPTIVEQGNGGTPLTAGEQLYFAYAYLAPFGTTLVSPSTSWTVQNAGDQIAIQVPPAYGITGIAVYVGTTSAVSYFGDIYLDGNGQSPGYPKLYLVGYGPYSGAPDPVADRDVPITIVFQGPYAAGAAVPSSNTTDINPVCTGQTSTAGTTTWHYTVCPLTYDGGMYVPASQNVTIANGPGYTSPSQYNTITWKEQQAPGYAVYAGGGGLLGFVTGTTFIDNGQAAITAPPNLPSTLPANSVADTLYTSIIAGGGSTLVMLKDAAITTSQTAYVEHDDTDAFQAIVNDLLASNGGELVIPVGTYNCRKIYLDNHQASTSGMSGNISASGKGRNSIIGPVLGYSGPIFGQNSLGLVNGVSNPSSVNHYDWSHLTFDGRRGTSAGLATYASGWYCLGGNFHVRSVLIQAGYNGCWIAGWQNANSYESEFLDVHVFNNWHVGLAISQSTRVIGGEIAANGGSTSGSGGSPVTNTTLDNQNAGVLCYSVNCKLMGLEWWSNAVHVRHYGDSSVIIGNDFDESIQDQIVLEQSASNHLITGNKFARSNNSTAPSSYASIRFQNIFGSPSGEHNAITGNSWQDNNTGSTYAWQYCVAEATNNDLNVIQGNTFTGGYAGTNPVSLVGTYTKYVANDVPIMGLTPPATPLVSSTVYQNTSNSWITIYQPSYAATSGTAGTISVALGNTTSPSALYTQQVAGTTSSTAPVVSVLSVPPGWYYSFAVSGATLANAQIQGG